MITNRKFAVKNRVPTDLELLNSIYEMHHEDFVRFDRDDSIRETKIYVPIDCHKIADELSVDADIILGRLYYHLEKKYGYKVDERTSVYFFAQQIGKDRNCINFSLLSSVLASLKQERSDFLVSKRIAIIALLLSSFSLGISFISKLPY